MGCFWYGITTTTSTLFVLTWEETDPDAFLYFMHLQGVILRLLFLKKTAWIKDRGGSLVPVWMTIPEAARACSELIKCGCKFSRGCTSCRCIKAGLSCTDLCTCKCENLFLDTL